MTQRLKLRQRAQADLVDIWTFTAERWSVEQADAYLIGLDDVLSLLCKHPEISRLHTELKPPVRIHRYRSHLVIYAVDDATLDVIRVVHGRSNWAEFLSSQTG